MPGIRKRGSGAHSHYTDLLRIRNVSKDNRTWLEKQEERKGLLTACAAQMAVLKQQVEASRQNLSTIDARIQQQKQEYNHWLFHWILDRQRKKLDKERQRIDRMLNDLDKLDQLRGELAEENEKPPPVRLRRTRVVSVPTEAVFVFLVLCLFIWCVSEWLLRR